MLISSGLLKPLFSYFISVLFSPEPTFWQTIDYSTTWANTLRKQLGHSKYLLAAYNTFKETEEFFSAMSSYTMGQEEIIFFYNESFYSLNSNNFF